MLSIQHKTQRAEDRPPECESDKKKVRTGDRTSSFHPPAGFASVPPGIFSQNVGPIPTRERKWQVTSSAGEWNWQIETPGDAPSEVEKERRCSSPKPDSAKTMASIAKTEMVNIAKRPFAIDARAALNDEEIKELHSLLANHRNEGEEINERDLEKLANLTVEVKAIGQWDRLAQGKIIVEVDRVLQNYHSGALRVWMIAVYDTDQTPLNHLNYYKFHEFLKTYFPSELRKLEQMPASGSYAVAKRANQIQGGEEKVKILNDWLNSHPKMPLQKTEPKSPLPLPVPSLPIRPLSRPFSLCFLGDRPFTHGRYTPLNADEKKQLYSLFESYKSEGEEIVEEDVERLANLTAEVKAIGRQRVLLQGKKIAEVECFLNSYSPRVFRDWLIVLYGNELTPKHYLNYYKFYTALSKSPKKALCPKFERMTPACAYSLASKIGDINKKAEIIENWNPEEKGKEAEKKLQAEIYQAFRKRSPREK